MKKNWNYTKCDEEGNHTSSFKEMVKFIRSNFTGIIKSYDITNNSMEIINECIFEDKGSYVIFYTVNEGLTTVTKTI